MRKAIEEFERHFMTWEIRLPEKAFGQREHGKINKAGWTIWYLFGSDKQGAYLDYYATHRMTSDSHIRIRESGTVESLPALEEMWIGAEDPHEDTKRKTQFLERNREVEKLLEVKGFLLSGDEPLANQVRRVQMTRASAEDEQRNESPRGVSLGRPGKAAGNVSKRGFVKGTPEMGLCDLQESYRHAQRSRFEAALDALPAPPLGKGNSNWAEYRLTLKLLVHEPVDAHDLLALFLGRLTKVGKEHVREVAAAIDRLLDERRENSGSLLLEELAEQAEDFEWRDWDLAYLNGAYRRAGEVVVRTLTFGASDEFRDLAYSVIRQAENSVREDLGIPAVRKRKAHRPRRAHKPPVAMKGFVAEESLPLPYVHYTGPYGSFLAFSETKNSTPHLCSCAEPAVANLIEITKAFPLLHRGRPSAFDYVFRDYYFPEAVIEIAREKQGDGIRGLPFADRLCHRCNLVSPKLRYCHEMYGSVFAQHHGWYVNQAHLRFGVLRQEFGDMLFPYLALVCPAEIAVKIQKTRADHRSYVEEEQRLQNMVQGPDRDDISPDEVTYWHNVKLDEAKPMALLRRQAAQSNRAISKFFENIAREEFGFRKVGERWVSETLLLQIVDRVFADEEVIHHHRPEWLDGLELDIYVPSHKVAFEYQGEQHFHPVEVWGGKEALRLTQQRDERKRELCAEAGIALVEIDYTEPLTEDHVRKRASDALAGQNGSDRSAESLGEAKRTPWRKLG